jgi:tripartite-type tricarboxylate transporter receptor subunit TctC
MMIARRIFLTALAALAMIEPSKAAEPQPWPQRPVRIIYPYAAGSSGDLTARLLAERFSQTFGQPFIVENRPGANGSLAAMAVARSPADGHTLLWAITPQIAIVPAMTKVAYDPVKDFTPISAVSRNTYVLVVNPNVRANSVADLVSYVRAQPNKLVYAEGGVGTIGHLAMVLFLKRAGLEMTNVTYKGNAPALTDVIAGHVPIMFTLLGDVLPHAVNGSVRLLAVPSEQRSRQAPNIPTMAEAGFPGFKADSWMGLMAPAGTPNVIVDRIAAEVARSVNDPKIAERLISIGLDPLGNRPAEFAAMISGDITAWGEAVRIAGVKLW